VDDADPLHEELRAAGVTIERDICDQEYGCRDFTIEDCNGYLLCFGHLLDGDREVAEELERQRSTLGEVMSDTEGLADHREGSERRELRWIAKHLGAGIDLRDKEALWAALDREADERP
jgi:hypothetical protein